MARIKGLVIGRDIEKLTRNMLVEYRGSDKRKLENAVLALEFALGIR